MELKQKIGLIGVGNMGTAILEGLLEKKIAAADQIWVYDKIMAKAEEFSSAWKVRKAASNLELVRNTEAVILAVKPQDLDSTADEIKSALGPAHVLISILAGTPVSKIRARIGPAGEVVRAMPNLGAKVGESMTALSGSSTQALAAAEKIFSGCGKTIRLEEKHFDLVTAVSGSGPAYFFLMMELLVKEGVQNGLNAEQARLLAVQTALGAAKLASAASENPDELRVKVTSKGGTTEAALKILEARKFAEHFHEALQAALNRGKELSQ